MFDELVNRESIEIILSEYNLEEVPHEIRQLQAVKTLIISRENLPGGWKIYPPQSAFENQIFEPPFHRLPVEITQLTGLTSLKLIGLDLVELPENLHYLKHLDTLDLALNKLIIKNELEKLKSLQKTEIPSSFW